MPPRKPMDLDQATSRAYDEGVKEGRSQGIQLAIDLLEYEYVGRPDRPARNSDAGQAVLELARKMGELLRAEKAR